MCIRDRAKFVRHLIQDNITLSSKSQIKSGFEFTSKVKDLNVPSNSKFISFDVSDMYTSIPRDDLLLVLKKNLEKPINYRKMKLKIWSN